MIYFLKKLILPGFGTILLPPKHKKLVSSLQSLQKEGVLNNFSKE